MSKSPGKKASLPEILELDGVSERNQAVLWLEQAVSLKEQIGKEPDKRNPDDKGTGLLGKYAELRERLGEFATVNGLEGVRHNSLVFSMQLREGRESVDLAAVTDYLLEHGVEAKLIGDAIAQAKRRGESFWVREISTLR